MMKIALVTNTPPPYRIPIFNKLASWPDINLFLIFATRREPNRHWDLPAFEFQHTFLREHFLNYRGRYIHHNPDILPVLWKLKPDVIITDGFNPTHLYAYLIARLCKLAHVAMTDGTALSEKNLSPLHKIIRRHVFAHTQAFLSASAGGDNLYQEYGIAPEQCFHSWLCVDNVRFRPALDAPAEKKFDFIFCGRFEIAKDPQFAIRVAYEAAQKMQRRLRLLMVGSGHEESALRGFANHVATWLEIEFYGFATQQALPALYQSAKIFLFPTHGDVWGIVANEACAAGLPCIVTPYAGVAGELIVDGENGFVRELNLHQWTDCAVWLLSDAALYRSMQLRSLQLVSKYHIDSAAEGLVDACRYALQKQSMHLASQQNANQKP